MTNQIDKNDVCIAMHTALRKYCDSDITSAIYNLIHLIHDMKPRKLNAWLILGELVADRLNSQEYTNTEAVYYAIERLDNTFYDRVIERKQEGKSLPANSKAALYALNSMLKICTSEDIERMAHLLI